MIKRINRNLDLVSCEMVIFFRKFDIGIGPNQSRDAFETRNQLSLEKHVNPGWAWRFTHWCLNLGGPRFQRFWLSKQVWPVQKAQHGPDKVQRWSLPWHLCRPDETFVCRQRILAAPNSKALLLTSNCSPLFATIANREQSRLCLSSLPLKNFAR